MIDHGTIQKILDTAEIVEVVGEFVALKKRGINYLGLCPFHNEKTPSFVVSPSKGIFKCFGCQKGGNSVNFIMEIEHLSYPEALKFLAQKYKIEIEEKELSPEEIKLRTERESMLVLVAFANKFFINQLHNTDEGKSVGLGYFKERKISQEMIDKFELGYSPIKYDSFSIEAKKSGYSIDLAAKSGLIVQKDNYTFDRFHSRVIFPIHSIAGKVIAFGGRILKTDKKVSKYVNSPESDIYHKSDIVYGIFQAKQSISKLDKCYLVEGYTDVISMHQVGIENVVASSGTSLTVNQIRLIRRFTNNITILYDGDAAGIKASLRGIDLVLEEEMNVKVLLFPDGEDPDSFSKTRRASEVVDFINENEQDFITFKTQLLLKEAKDPVEKANLITSVVNSISKISDQIKRSVFVKECSKLLNTSEDILYAEINKNVRKETEKNYYKPQRETINKTLPPADINTSNFSCESYEKEISRVMIIYGDQRFKTIVETEEGEDEIFISVAGYILNEIGQDYDFLKFNNPVYSKIYHEIQAIFESGRPIDEKFFSNHVDIEISKTCSDLLIQSYILSKFWERNENIISTKEIDLEKNIPHLILEYKDKRVHKELKDIEILLQTEKSIEKIDEALSKYMLLKQINIELSKRLGERTII